MIPKGTPEYWAQSHPWLTLFITTPIIVFYLCLMLLFALVAVPCMLVERLLGRTKQL